MRYKGSTREAGICPVCGEQKIWENYTEKIEISVCPKCGYPQRSKMMEYYKDNPVVMDFRYAMLDYITKTKGFEIRKTPRGGVYAGTIPNVIGWNMCDNVRGGIMYALINLATDGSFYEFRGIYTSPHLAENAKDEIEDENERRGIKAKVHVDCVLVNHPLASSMFKEKE